MVDYVIIGVIGVLLWAVVRRLVKNRRAGISPCADCPHRAQCQKTKSTGTPEAQELR